MKFGAANSSCAAAMAVALLFAAVTVIAAAPAPKGSTATLYQSRRHARPRFAARGLDLRPSRAAIGVDGEEVFAAATACALRGGEITHPDVPKPSELAGASFFLALIVAMGSIFKKLSVPIPAMLAVTVLTFAFMVLAEVASPGSGDMAFVALQPGANILTKWLPVMFVPGLAMLPLAPSLGSPIEAVKVLLLVFGGFFFTMSTTGYLVQGMRSAMGLIVDVESGGKIGGAQPPAATALTKPAKPFSGSTLNFLLGGTVIGGALSVAATRTDSHLATPLRTAFMLFATVLAFVFGARLPPAFTKIVHPLVTSTAGTLAVTKLNAILTGSTFEDVLRTYKSGTVWPLTSAGAGDILLFLLGPAVGCFSVAMYSRKKIMAENLAVVVAAMLCSSLGGLFGTSWAIRLFSIGGLDANVRAALVPRNVTTALALVISNLLGGNMAICASVVVLTGIFGATVGRATLDFLGIQDPVSRGLGMGAAGQGLGVAAMSVEKEAFPFAAINMVLTAVSATAFVSVPAVREMILRIITGGITD